MRKIMFNDKYGLTKAVLSGSKTQTRRIIPKSVIQKIKEYQLQYFNGTLDVISEEEAIEQIYFVERSAKLPYQMGEMVAIAQCYKDAGVDYIPEEDDEFGCYNFPAEQTSGWTNKMFVRSDLMPHRIRITNIRVERLQDISDENCMKEGITWWNCQNKVHYGFFNNDKNRFHRSNSPREAYANLIDKISSKGTWESNPFVWVYDFELIKPQE